MQWFTVRTDQIRSDQIVHTSYRSFCADIRLRVFYQYTDFIRAWFAPLIGTIPYRPIVSIRLLTAYSYELTDSYRHLIGCDMCNGSAQNRCDRDGVGIPRQQK